jgi:hypothetical protein
MATSTRVGGDATHQTLDDVIRCVLAVPWWDQTAVLHGMTAVLRHVIDGGCAFALETDQIHRMRRQIERLLANDPLVRLRDALIEAERRLEHDCPTGA